MAHDKHKTAKPPDTTKALRIKIRGRVQGIGFRPFIYRLALEHSLGGWVYNDQDGVVIHAEGATNEVDAFLQQIPEKAPTLSYIDTVESSSVNTRESGEFSIRESAGSDEKTNVHVLPDIATCDDCLRELFDPEDRRYMYPFINCTNCGPRFTIIKDVPYDRPLTTMSEFTMCEQCSREYESPDNRRYHAQPNACPVCGPHVRLLTRTGEKTGESAPLIKTQQLLREGKILAIKGLGGYHLACDALNPRAVHSLRTRKHREDKPFAVMMPDIETVRTFCNINENEKSLLTSYKRPIVLLRKKMNTSPSLAPDVAPRNPWLGVMLPYTPLHHILFHNSGLQVLVMTSGNLTDEPIAYIDSDAVKRLKNIADFFHTHNRKIHRRVDDSVVRVMNNAEYLLRRARGYAPIPIKLNSTTADILATGAEMKNTFCITHGEFAYVSHHLGDLENIETIESFEHGIDDFRTLFHLAPQYVAHDLHPDYVSTHFALQKSGLPPIAVQHHHAHIAGVLAEHEMNEKVIGFAFDGTGYGDDETIWGGETLIADMKSYERFATLRAVPMPGSAMAIKEPWRMGMVYLEDIFGDETLDLDIPFLKNIEFHKWNLLKHAVKKSIHTPLTTSIGRLFDGISAILNVRTHVNFEGQAAMELECMATGAKSNKAYPVRLLDSPPYRIDFAPIIEGIVNDIIEGTHTATIARRFHDTLIEIIRHIAERAHKETGISTIALGGGCFQNYLLTTGAIRSLEKNGFRVLLHTHLPPNDGAISLGQAAVANARLQ